ncbi:hypothetical protein CEE37_09610 [candidate division LCP-89 bacterium B3_LCP]|uniref:Secretion system C-terminal sorting domain-containing protein n=1 Tax=candidate division LCP-89 bacterium B3_LCP TaxID=2012998 RepID=A0A532UYJ4_UNCL8|nr:MAG: hypothetical protein CEE37_09610 [candidate division LCP-89 bacterium B3_LCP]
MRRFTEILSILLLLTCVIYLSPALAAQVRSSDTAVSIIETRLLDGKSDDVVIQVWGPVGPNTEVRSTQKLIMRTPEAGYVIYIDDFPTANLFHPVRYAFVSETDGEVTVKNAQSSPLNFRDFHQVKTAIGDVLGAAENRRAPLPSGSPDPTRSDRWAVLMNGGHNQGNNHVRYWNDLSNIYIALNWTYGFADDHIIVLCSDGLNPAPDQSNGLNSDPDLDGDGDDDIMYSCTLSDVDFVFGELVNMLAADDKLFIFATDHGSSVSGWSTLFNLWNMESLYDYHFASLLDALPQCEIICTFEPCYSGGFLDDIAVPPGPRVASSACSYDQVSYAMPPDYMYDTYVFHWTAAVKGEDAYGVPVDADYNSDGMVTMDEAFYYAETHDQSNEDPQYAEYPVGIGAGISLWPTGSGPFLVVADKEIDDIGGNNNGAADPGETISMVLTLSNAGSGTASNIVGTLSTTDPYLTVTQNTATFPDLAHFEQGQGTPPYQIDISSSCPQGQSVSCDLHIEADSAYTNDLIVSFIVGDPMYAPVGPDAYGYYAYDILDVPLGPTYDWVEISADSGGPGTMVNFTADDQVFHFALPFGFQFYGATYDSFTVAANGWIGMGTITEDDYSNSGIPDADGPPSMIAIYWEDLSPQRANSGKVWSWYDETNHRQIVEYNHIEQFAPTGSFETFQVILLDAVYYPTATGDGQILFQYKEPSPTVQAEGTIGIENSAETIGLQYVYDGAYDEHAAPIDRGMAILFTALEANPFVVVELYPVNPPIQIPATGGIFGYSIMVANNEGTSQNVDLWIDVTLPSGSPYGPVVGPLNLTLPAGFANDRDREQAVPINAPAGTYQYNAYLGLYPTPIYSTSSFDFEKLATGDGEPVSGWANWGESFELLSANETELPDKFALLGCYPNPFNPTTVLRFQMPDASLVNLTIFDISGRKVAELISGWRDAGVHEVTFDGTGLASGIYIYQLDIGSHSASSKMVMMK